MTNDKVTVFAIIVSYNPDFDVFTRIIEKTVNQVEGIVIVDNGSDEKFLGGIKDYLAIFQSKVSFHTLPENIGIAAAQNRGLAVCSESNFTHIVFLDHDSIPDADMVRNLLDVESKLLESGKKVGAVGPTCVDRRTNTPSGFVIKKNIFISRIYPDEKNGYVETDFLISSGTLVRRSILDLVGGMNEGYFIDHVDTEWCFRIKNTGHSLYGSYFARLNHSLGENVVKIWLGRWREVPQHKSFRYYYIFRNTIKMITHTPMSMSWKLTHIYRLFLFLTFFSLFGAGRLQRLKMIFFGVRDGLKNRNGILPQ